MFNLLFSKSNLFKLLSSLFWHNIVYNIQHKMDQEFQYVITVNYLKYADDLWWRLESMRKLYIVVFSDEKASCSLLAFPFCVILVHYVCIKGQQKVQIEHYKRYLEGFYAFKTPVLWMELYTQVEWQMRRCSLHK